jgi:hypothetical protein
MPSRKWFATQVTAVAALLTMLVTTGSWDLEESVALIGLVSQAAIGYLTPNTGPVAAPAA